MFAQNDSQNSLLNAINGRYGNSNNGKKLIQCTVKNTTSIEIFRDGDAASVGHPFYITIKDGVTIRHAGDYYGMSGIIDTYYDYSPFHFKRIVQMINQAKLYKVTGLKPNKNRKGITKINFYKGDICWMTLIDSKDKLNVLGDFKNLVDSIVEYTGGEPEFGGALGSEPEQIPDTESVIELDEY